jgi:NitT/TauT family transport system substrate-binding protein
MSAIQMSSMTRTRRPRKAFAVLAASLALVTAAACSSSSKPASSSSSAQALTSISLAYPTLSIHVLPYQIGIDQGIFAKHGLKVKLVSLSNSQTTVASLTSNSVQYAGVGSTGLLTAASQGAAVQSVLAQDLGVPQELVVSKKFAAANNLTTDSPPADVAKALGHSTFGVNGLSDQGLAKQLMGAYNVSTSGVKFASLGSLSALQTEITSGGVDAIILSAPNSYKLVTDGAGVIVADQAKIPSWPTNIFQFVLAVNTSYAAAHAALTKQVVAAIHESVVYITQHPDQALKSAQTLFPGFTTDDLTQSIKTLPWAANGSQTQDAWQTTITFNSGTGAVKAGVAATEGKTWTNDYYPAS